MFKSLPRSEVVQISQLGLGSSSRAHFPPQLVFVLVLVDILSQQFWNIKMLCNEWDTGIVTRLNINIHYTTSTRAAHCFNNRWFSHFPTSTKHRRKERVITCPQLSISTATGTTLWFPSPPAAHLLSADTCKLGKTALKKQRQEQ